MNNNSILSLKKIDTSDLQYEYDQIDLMTGSIQTLFEVILNSSNISSFTPQEISYDQTEVTFIINRATINDKVITYPTIMIYNLMDKTFTYKDLPNNNANIEIHGVSSNGEYVFYSTYNVVNGVQQSITYLYNFTTQKSITLSNQPGVSLGSGPYSQ